MNICRYIIFVFALFYAVASLSQANNRSNLRTKKIATIGIVKLDSLSIVPNTIIIPLIDTSFYTLEVINASLNWKKKSTVDSVQITYRVFPYKLNAASRRYVFDSIRNNFIAEPSIINKSNYANLGGNGFLDFGSLEYNGSFGRSLSFGNSQDVVVNSQFNLQLNGLIGDSIQIAAAITDNNIPIQPDGTTQQLNEFDRVALQFKKKGWEVNLGDIDLRQNGNYFLQFYKRLQGASYSRTSNYGENTKNKILLSGAIAKGKFTRNIFQGSEGNQGPYRLRGVNNEIYFIVLAGTERVFIDGQVMQRGEDKDYIINYNTAEVTFTQHKMITKDSRIQIEFEYAERSFLNSMLYASNELQLNKKLIVQLAAYSNADAKNSPINQPLDQKQRAFLNDVGDSIQNALFPNAIVDSFSATKILYAFVDTLVNANRFTAYVYSTNPDSAKYNLSFIEVGFGKGNYINDYNGANGKVYKWVAPINGLPQGNFEPATFLVTPKKQQVFTASATYNINDKMKLTTEVAMSNYDINTLSTKQKNDNKDFGGRFALSRLFTLPSAKSLQLKTNVGYEIEGKNFRTVERLRTPEFYRDWGLPYQPTIATEQLTTAGIELKDAANNVVSFQSFAYLRSDNYKGIKQILTNQHNIKGVQVNGVFNFTHISSTDTAGYFLRPSIDISKTLPNFHSYVIGSSYSLEKNNLRKLTTDSIVSSSFSFDILSAYIKSNPTKDNHWSLNYFTRSDQMPFANSLNKINRSHNINLYAELLKNTHHQVRLNATYRQLNVANASLSSQQAEKTLLSRIEYLVNEFKGLLTGNLLYEIGAGQEQRRDFSYIEVPAGRGDYAWNDYNGDGIPQLNEFEVALFPDQAKFIRIFTPTNQFVKANYTQFNYSFSLNPRTVVGKWKNKKIAQLIGLISLQSSLQIGKKEIADKDILFNPFKGAISDTSLITLTNMYANTFSFNRFSSIWGFDVSNIVNRNKVLLTYGFESRKSEDWNIKARWNFTKQLTIDLTQRLGKNLLTTPSFSNKNYAIDILLAEPRFTYTRGTNYRVSASYQYMKKINLPLYGGEQSVNHSLNVETKYNAVNNTSLLAKFSYIKIDYVGQTNSTISYIMLDALLPGKNLLWNFDFTKRISNSLELSFQYEGRKPAQARTIHLGRASLRAIL